MNKLSSCELFKLVDDSFKNTIVKTIVDISENISKYTIPFEMYDYLVKNMRSYKYTLSKLVVKSSLSQEIVPLILIDPKNSKDNQIFLPSAIATICNKDGSKGYVDLSPRAKYNRNEKGIAESIKLKEIDLYTYLQMSFIDLYLKKQSGTVNGSAALAKQTAVAFSRLFSRCIDRTYPISANTNRFNVSLFLSAVYCLVVFFERDIEDAKNIVFSSGISNRAEIESDCRVLINNKLNFTNLTEFLAVYGEEFEDYIKEGSLTLRYIVNMFTKMYGANSYFALEHGASFMNMILCIPIGIYNDKFITKSIKAQTDKIEEILLTIFSSGSR